MDDTAKKSLNDAELDEVSGGFTQTQTAKYTAAEYARAGITWQQNQYRKDKFFYQGRVISQAQADKICDSFYQGIKDFKPIK